MPNFLVVFFPPSLTFSSFNFLKDTALSGQDPRKRGQEGFYRERARSGILQLATNSSPPFKKE